MNLITNIKNYFKAKSEGDTTLKSPEGICPNCWGKQEWEGEFYEFIKGSKNENKDDTYNNFINKIVESNIDGIKIKTDTYTCATCNMKYKN